MFYLNNSYKEVLSFRAMSDETDNDTIDKIVEQCDTLNAVFNSLRQRGDRIKIINIADFDKPFEILRERRDYALINLSISPFFGGKDDTHGIHAYGSSVMYTLDESR